MEIILNILLIMLSTTTAICGINFFIKNKGFNNTSAYVLGYNLGAALWCLSYGLIGLCANLELVKIIRVFGLLGLMVLMVTDYYMASNFSGINKTFKNISRIIIILFSITDLIIFSNPIVDTFIRKGNWTTWNSNECWQRTFHTFYVITLFLILLFNAILWVIRENVKRRRKFMWLMIIANFALIFASIPDTFFSKFHMAALPTSGFGGAICALLIWYGAEKLNAFDISIENTINRIYNNINVGILIFDENKKLVLANPYANKILGTDKNNIVAKGMSDFFDISQNEVDSYFENTLSNGEQSIQLTSKQTSASCSVNTTVALDNFNEPYCYVTAIYDMTKLNEIMVELKAANQAKSDFLTSMSHEIRTPINAMLGLDEIILREATDKNIRGYATDIQEAGRFLLSIINDILDFSKIESGKLDIIPVDYQLSSLANDCYNMIHTKAKAKNLNFVFENDEKLPKVLHGDEIRIRQIIINILTNAIKYTNKGFVKLIIGTESLSKDMVTLKITVSDSGIGIKEESLPVLFESFKRIDETKNRHIEGTGLGLSITKQLVDKMNGEIKVSSVYGKGSTFTVLIPQKVIDPTPIGNIFESYVNVSVPGEEYTVSFHAPTAKVLVVDDVEMNLSVFKGLLKQTKINIDTATNGLLALDMIKENTYDIIFMDHMMPDMDGVEALSHILADKTHPNQDTPVIVLTANAIAGVSNEYRALGFTDYLSKPVQSKLLENMLMKYLPEEKIDIENENTENISISNTASRNITESISEKAKRNYNTKNNSLDNNENVKTLALLDQLDFLDTASAMEYCLNDEAFYREVLDIYLAEDKSEELDEALAQSDWKNYQVKVHALKSTSLNIGANELSESAKLLEIACKNGDYSYVRANHEALMEAYSELLDKLSGILQ